jgi:uncharacterized protein YbjQ (UPF0145 family)
MNEKNTSTTFEIAGFKIVENFGIIRGIVVRSRSVIGNIGAGIQTLFGGNISLYTSLCEQARKEAFELMLIQADDAGADGVVGVRYDATEVMGGVTEVLCYGTAVKLEAIN